MDKYRLHIISYFTLISLFILYVTVLRRSLARRQSYKKINTAQRINNTVDRTYSQNNAPEYIHHISGHSSSQSNPINASAFDPPVDKQQTICL